MNIPDKIRQRLTIPEQRLLTDYINTLLEAQRSALSHEAEEYDTDSDDPDPETVKMMRVAFVTFCAVGFVLGLSFLLNMIR